MENLLKSSNNTDHNNKDFTKTPASKKLKSSTILDDDLELDSMQPTIDSDSIPINNHSAFVFQWRDVRKQIKKVTAVITLPSGVDPSSVTIKLLVTPGKSELSSDKIFLSYK